MFGSYVPSMKSFLIVSALVSCIGLAIAAPRVAQTQAATSDGAQAAFAGLITQARSLGQLETLIVSRDGDVIIEEAFRGNSTSAPTNIKSASKSIISALVGIAIDKGVLEGPDQKIAPLLRDKLPERTDLRIEEITIGNLLSMQAGLGSTSGGNYGSWVGSADWVRAALAQPFVDDPGEGMLYSTGSTHLLSAILSRESGRSTLELTREWLEPLDGFEVADWERGPQGVYLGGNQMAMSPKSLLAFGELYRSGGRAGGKQIVSPGWIKASWEPRAQSMHSGESYGYGWFLTEMGGHEVVYAWGHGGQMLYIVPSLSLTVVMTSAEGQVSVRSGYRDDLHDLMRATIDALAKTSGGHS